MTPSLASARYAQNTYLNSTQSLKQIQSAIWQNSKDLLSLLATNNLQASQIIALQTAIASLPASITSKWVVNEIPTFLGGSSWSVLFPYVPGSLQVIVGYGLRNPTQYIEAPTTGIFDLSAPPEGGQAIYVNYIKA